MLATQESMHIYSQNTTYELQCLNITTLLPLTLTLFALLESTSIADHIWTTRAEQEDLQEDLIQLATTVQAP